MMPLKRSAQCPTEVLKTGPALARAVKFLRIDCYYLPDQNASTSVDEPLLRAEEIAVSILIDTMPNLTSLSVEGRRDIIPDTQLPRLSLNCAMAKSRLEVTTLSLITVVSSSADLAEVLAPLSNMLKRIKLGEVTSRDGEWCAIFEMVQFLQLERLEIEALRGLHSTPEAWKGIETVSLLPERTRINKAVRGPRGIECYWMKSASASMTGSTAVHVGLKDVIDRLGRLHW